MKAKAAVFMGENRPFEVREFEVTETPAGYGRSELIASGVCGTDVHIHRGKLGNDAPAIIGHEFVGKLVDLDENEGVRYGLKKGDNVIADIAMPCGECLLCKNGDDANCVCMGETSGRSIDEAPYLFGGYTEVNYTPLTNLIKIPDGLDPLAVCIFACPGPTAMHAFSLAERAGIKISSGNIRSAVVQGFGPVGAYAALYLKTIGIEKVYVIISSENEKREALAREFGVDDVFVIARDGVDKINERLLEENSGLGVDLVFEASGAPSAVAQGIAILRNRGVYLIPGQYSNSGGVTIQPQDITFKALQILGSSQYSFCDVHAYLEFLDTHREVVDKIVKLGTAYPVSEVNQAFKDAESGRNVKTVLIK
ncbi:MAG: alcohol dehydrogenase catalytic domain-containing protein [Clostridiales bacterium]|nr:alcohol dehydrogenase catalytic domain-containing protein [Clostridiales bacterium]